MARVKRETFYVCNEAGKHMDFSVQVNITTDGIFYAKPPEWIREIMSPLDHNGNVQALTLRELKGALQKALDAYAVAEAVEEHVIKYYVQSEIAFAVDKAGNICPNAGWDKTAKWSEGLGTRLREIHATSRVDGGYMLKIGAVALTKTTHKFGGKERVTYCPYNKGAANLDDQANPAAMLNAWCGIRMPDEAEEMPYSDEAAMFFYYLMMGMAELCRRVDEKLSSPKQIQKLIKSHGPHRLPFLK